METFRDVYSTETGEVFDINEARKKQKELTPGTLRFLPNSVSVIEKNGKRYVELKDKSGPINNSNFVRNTDSSELAVVENYTLSKSAASFTAQAQGYFDDFSRRFINPIVSNAEVVTENNEPEYINFEEIEPEESFYQKSITGVKNFFERAKRKADEVLDTTGKKVIAVIVAGSIMIGGIVLTAKEISKDNLITKEIDISMAGDATIINPNLLNKVYYYNENGDYVPLYPTEIVSHCTIYDQNNPNDLFWFDNALIAQLINEFGEENFLTVLSMVYADENMQRYGGEPIYNWNRICQYLGKDFNEILNSIGYSETEFKAYGEQNTAAFNQLLLNTKGSSRS